MPVIYEKKDHIAYITLNRPKAYNALDPETVVELARLWPDYRDDNDLYVAIITGAGDKAFCSGLDLDRMISLETGARAPETEADRLWAADPRLLDQATLRDFVVYKPIIAAVNGFAIAGGMELVQACDLRIASENARFGLQEVKWGLFPRGGSTVRLPRQISYCQAMEIMLTGELIDAQEACRIGLVNRVVPQNQLMAEAEGLARKIAQNGPLAVRAVKESVLRCTGLPLKQGLDLERDVGLKVYATRDAQEGPRAFLEKRKPVFTGN